MITLEDIRNAGYKVAMTNSEAEVARLCGLVDECYISKLWPNFDVDDADVKSAEVALVFVMLVNASVSATRSGGKVKLSPQQSERGYVVQRDLEEVDIRLRKLQGKVGSLRGLVSELVDDVEGIYLRNVFVKI